MYIGIDLGGTNIAAGLVDENGKILYTGPYLSPNVAVHPLRPATDRRHGGPLPRHPANVTRAYPFPNFFNQQKMPLIDTMGY